MAENVLRLPPLFEDEAAYEAFKEEHNKYKVKRGDLATYKGNCFIGVDAGSTTTKVALVGSMVNYYTTSIAATTEVR